MAAATEEKERVTLKKSGIEKVTRALMAALTPVLLAAGCAGPGTAPDGTALPVQTAAQAEQERLSIQEAAAETLEGYSWPRSSIWKTVMGKEVEFVLYHGNGWTIHVPAAWEQTYAGTWAAPSGCASFSVSKQFLGVEAVKAFRARQGSWQHETDHEPPFDYYYDDDGGYTPPAGSADYIYYFAPDGENRSYEFTLQTVTGETSEEEERIQEAMLLSFCLDESSHVLRAEPYTLGRTEWDAAMAGLKAEGQRIWFSWYHDGAYVEVDGKGGPDYLSYAMALEAHDPTDFTETFFGKRPEGAETAEGEPITLCLPDMGIWLYVYDQSPWIHILHAGEDYWARSSREEPVFDTVRAWLEAECGWATAGC